MNSHVPRQVLIVSSIDWAAAWQRHQAFAAAFAAEGAEVFFIENTGFRDFRLSDLTRILSRLARFLTRRPRMASPPPKGVRIFTPLVLPPTRSLFRAVNSVYLLPFLMRRLRRRGLKPGAVVFAYLPTATTLTLIELVHPSQVVYDCVDNFAGHPTPPPDLRATEDALLRRAAAVLTTARTLFDDKAARHKNVHLIHHGTDAAFLGTPRPRGPVRSLCYFGTVWSALDYDAIRGLADSGFEVTLAGPVKEPPPELPPGVRFAPALPHARLPGFLKSFDALLLPYRRSEYNNGVVPAKLYECMATGKPVLSAALPSLMEFSDLLYLAREASDYPEAARRMALEDDRPHSARRIAVARGHSTPAQVRRVAAVLAASPALPPAPLPKRMEGGEAFLRGFSWIAGLFTLARLSTFGVQFLGARFLGASAYGTAHMVIAVASLAQVAPTLGFPLAQSHFTASTDDDRKRGRLSATIFSLFAGWTVLCLAAGILFAPGVQRVTGLSSGTWALAGALALMTAVHHVASGSLQGLGRFKARGAVEALYGIVSLGALASFLTLGHHSYSVLIESFIIGIAAASTVSLWLVLRRGPGSFDRRAIPEILPFVGAGAVYILSTALIQAPGRLITFHVHDAAQTGLYSAYFSCTIQVSLAVSNMLQTVLLPVASSPKSNRPDWAAVRDMMPAALALVWVLFFGGATAVLSLLGRDYPLRLTWLLLFSAAATLVCAHGVLASLFFARGAAGIKDASLGALTAGVANLAANLCLTPLFGMTGAAASLCLGYSAGLAWYLARLRAEASP